MEAVITKEAPVLDDRCEHLRASLS